MGIAGKENLSTFASPIGRNGVKRRKKEKIREVKRALVNVSLEG